MSYEYDMKKELCSKELMSRFPTLGYGIVSHVAEKCDFDVNRTDAALMQMMDCKPRIHLRVPRIENAESYQSIDEIEDCIDDILSGIRVLVILRGLPGSGKSHLAKSILKACFSNPAYKNHIHSADDFFVQNGEYVFDSSRISDAHDWNQGHVSYRMQEGYSPVIVDNTNTQIWEMRSYAAMAANNGYKIVILEVNTTWCFSIHFLTARNQHMVPRKTIQTMLDRYQMGITPEKLLQSYRCSTEYQTNPKLRRCPPLDATTFNGNYLISPSYSLPRSRKKDSSEPSKIIHMAPAISKSEKPISFLWEREPGETVNVWKELEVPPIQQWVVAPQKPSTSDAGTNTSLVDFEERTEDLKVIYGKPREITNFRQQMIKNRPGMLDKGCWTQEDIPSDRNEDLKKLIDIFQNVPPMYIRDMYDDCKGNFDMTFEIFLEDNKNYSHLPYTLENVVSNTNEVKEAVMSRNDSMESLTEACNLSHGTLDEPMERITNHLLGLLRTPTQPKKAPVVELSKTVSKDLYGFPSTSTGCIKKQKVQETPETSDDDNEASDFDSNSSPSDSDIIELNLGEFLVKQLEKEVGDPHSNFPEGFQPVVQLPRSLARQLYAFYIESAYRQMDNQQTVLQKLTKEDEAFAHKLYEEEIGLVRQQPQEGLQEIMNEQAAMKIHQKQLPVLKTPTDIATQLTKKKLFESFPTVDQGVIMELYHANCLDYQQTVSDLISSVGEGNTSADLRKSPISDSTLEELEQAQRESQPAQGKEEEKKTAEDYRREAEYYLRKRDELYRKAQENCSRGQSEVAQFYCQLGKEQTKYYDMANSKAASLLMEGNAKQLHDINTLDLHYLYVKEAISALDLFIDSKIVEMNEGKGKMTQEFLIITGRGNRSRSGTSRLRPAVMRRLESRRIRYHQMNPGLLKIRLRKDARLTNDLNF